MAQAAVDKLTVSYVVRHLGFAEMAAGRLDGARELPEQSVRLRRRSSTPGVAAKMLSLTKLATRFSDRTGLNTAG